MCKRILIIVMLGILIIGGLIHLFSPPSVEESYQYLYKLINQEYGIVLTPTNSEVISYKAIYSRDYACVISFRLASDCSSEIEDVLLSDTSWTKASNSDDVVNDYIVPSLSSFSNLSKVKECCDDGNTYVKLIVWEDIEYAKSFSIVAVNTERNELHYFTVK